VKNPNKPARQNHVRIALVELVSVRLPDVQGAVPISTYQLPGGKWSKLMSLILNVDNTSGGNTCTIMLQVNRSGLFFLLARTDPPLTAFGWDGQVAFGIGAQSQHVPLDSYSSTQLPDTWLPPDSQLVVTTGGLDRTAQLQGISAQFMIATPEQF